jgi:hypothetical protein
LVARESVGLEFAQFKQAPATANTPMKTHKLSDIQSVALALLIGAAIAPAAMAYDLTLGTNVPPITFHGFASQGFLFSSDYNYLDNDSKNGSFRFTEAGLNASINPFPRTHITAQAFTYDIGPDVGKFDVILDYASIDYTFNDKIGIRAGRIRRPEGIYNSIQDIDLARTFVLLPQGVYDARWRDFYVSLDGAELFGDLPMGKAGDLSYEAYGGVVNPALDGGLGKKLRSVLPSFVTLDSFGASPQTGLQLWWNTPLNGLRIGAMGGDNLDFEYTTTAFGSSTENHNNVPFAQGSIEYLWKSWTFQTEYFTYIVDPDIGASSRADAWYVSAAYRFNKWLEAGTYYSESYNDVSMRSLSQQYQKDLALTLRFDLRDWWIFKVEGHYIHGTGLLNDYAANPSQDNRGWFMLAVKTTVSF